MKHENLVLFTRLLGDWCWRVPHPHRDKTLAASWPLERGGEERGRSSLTCMAVGLGESWSFDWGRKNRLSRIGPGPHSIEINSLTVKSLLRYKGRAWSEARLFYWMKMGERKKKKKDVLLKCSVAIFCCSQKTLAHDSALLQQWRSTDAGLCWPRKAFRAFCCSALDLSQSQQEPCAWQDPSLLTPGGKFT